MNAMTFTVRYQYGTYSGTRVVNARDCDDAIAKVKAIIRREGSLTMVSESYKVVGCHD